VAALPGSEN
jgi:uncharacterized membrane protein YeaQ/YmgE (transglycosylase-associated protein family)